MVVKTKKEVDSIRGILAVTFRCVELLTSLVHFLWVLRPRQTTLIAVTIKKIAGITVIIDL